MKYDVLTIFPELFDSFAKESLMRRAREKRLLELNVHNLRDWAPNRHRTVDDRPFGGGLGQVFLLEPIFQAVGDLKKKNSRVVLFSPRGRPFDQKQAHRYAKLSHLILICGRYEGVDERVATHVAHDVVSLGEYVLMGGEIPAMAVMEAVSRLIPGVVGKPEFLSSRTEKRRGGGGRAFAEYPQYTRPEVFEPRRGVRWPVPKVLLSGDHKKIEKWREEHRKQVGK